MKRRLEVATEPIGEGALRLEVGTFSIEFRGLPPDGVRGLTERWGPFVSSTSGDPDLEVGVRRAGGERFLDLGGIGGLYRIEAVERASAGTAVSHHFVLGPEAGPAWRLAVTDGAEEPFVRILDNAARFLVARLAAGSGGIALHGAGVLRGGVAHVFAGPSRAGKSTASTLSERAASLGDDFAVALPRGGAWVAAAVPFDNAETVPLDRPTGLHPLAAVWRIFQADAAAIERPTGVRAAASLLSCAAFPWALPDLLDRLGEAAGRIVEAGRFGHLRFGLAGDFWARIDEEARGGC